MTETAKEPYDIQRSKELTDKLMDVIRPVCKGYTFPEIIVAMYSAITTLTWEKMTGEKMTRT